MTEYAAAGDAEVPKVGLGTWRMTGETCVEAVRSALELGYRHVDTAQRYGNERQVGAAIRESAVDREDVFLTTKVWARNARHDDVIESTRGSLDRLGTDYVDLLLIHWPYPLVGVEETIGAMAELREEGAVRHIGVSNYGVGRLDRAREATDAPILTNQVEYHPYKSREKLLSYCREHDLLLTAYSPLAHGGVLRDERLAAIGERYDKSAAQVALRWLIQQDNVITIPKATSREHQRANLAIFDFELTDEEMERIRRPSLFRRATAWARGRLGV